MQKNIKFINTVLCSVFFINGSFYGMNQLLVNNITRANNATDNQMAIMISALYAGPMLMVLLFGIMADKIGRIKSCVIAILFMVIGSFLVASMPSIYIITFGFLLYGIGVGGMESVIFTITSDVNGDKAGQKLIFYQAVFSIGAMISPIICTRVLELNQYKLAYMLMCVICMILSVVVFKLPFKDKAVQITESNISLVKMISNPFLIVLIISIIISTGSESAFTYWTGVFFDSIGAIEIGAVALSTYWLASIIGRLSSSFIKNVEKLVFPCFLLASIGTLSFIIIPNPYAKLVGMLVVGISFAPLYPALGYLSSKVFPENTGKAFAIITFSSNLGGVVSQPIIGAFGENIAHIYILICTLCLLMAIMLFISLKKYNFKENLK